jgi:hypothetical protein
MAPFVLVCNFLACTASGQGGVNAAQVTKMASTLRALQAGAALEGGWGRAGKGPRGAREEERGGGG